MALAFADAWKLVRSYGLRRAAFYRMDYDTVRDALYLITQGVPVKRLVRILNGKRPKEQLRKKRQGLAKTYAGALKQGDYLLTAAHLASVLAKLAPGALMAELQASDPQVVKRAYLLWLQQERKTRLQILSELPEPTLKEAWLEAIHTASAVKEKVGPEVITRWLQEN